MRNIEACCEPFALGEFCPVAFGAPHPFAGDIFEGTAVGITARARQGSGYAVLLQFEGRLSHKNRSAAWDTLRGHAQGNPMSASSASLSLTRCGLWRLPIRSPHSGVMRPELAPAS